MNSAYLKLGEVLDRTEFRVPQVQVICNVDAQPVSDSDAIRNALREQVTGTVRWSETIERLLDHDKIEQFIELGPGGVIAALANRIRKGTPVISIFDVPGLEVAVTLLTGA